MPDVDVTNLRLPRTWVTTEPNNPAFDISANELDDDIRVLGDTDWGANKLQNVLDPTLAQDVATKNYVDTSNVQNFFDTAGTGLTSTGSTVNAIGTANRITVNANDIDIASTYVGQLSITTLGTITAGTWNGTDIVFANIQQIATARILGRTTAATGDIEELTGTSATTLLDVFTSTLKGLAPLSGGGTTNFLRADGTWAAPPGGGSQTPWTSDIDAADFSLQNLDILDFNTVTATPVAAAAQIWWNTASSMFLNVPTGDSFDFTVNAVSQMLINVSSIDFQNNNLVDIDDITPTSLNSVIIANYATNSNTLTFTGKTYDADAAGNVLTNVGSSEIKSEIITGQATVTAVSGDFLLLSDTGDAGNLKKINANDFLGGASQTPWTSDIDAANNSLSNLDKLEFNNNVDVPVITQAEIYFNTATTGLNFNAPAADELTFRVAGVIEYTMNATELNLEGNNLAMADNTDILWSGSADRKIKNTTGGFEFEVETGDTFQFTIQDGVEYIFNAATADFNANTITDVGSITVNAGAQVIVNTDATNSGFSDLGNAGDPSAAAEGDMYYNLTANEYRFFNGTVWITMDGSGGGGANTALSNLASTAVNATINMQSNILTFGSADISITGVTADLEYDVATGEQHRWRVANVNEMILTGSALDILNNNLTVGSGTINFLTAGTSISEQTSDLIFDVSTGDIFSFDIAGVPEVTISATQMDLTTMNLVNAVTTGSVTGVSGITGLGTQSQGLNMGNNNITIGSGLLDFLTVGTSISEQASDLIFDVSTGDFFSFDIAGVPEVTIDAANMDMNQNNIIDLPGTFISALTTVTGISGDFIMISDTTDSGNLKKVDALDFLGGASQTPWLQDINADTFALTWLGEDAVLPSIGVEYITNIAAGLRYNVATGKTHAFGVNGTENMTLSLTSLDLVGDAKNITMIGSGAVGFIQMAEITDPAAGTASGKFYVKDVAAVSKPFFIGEGQAAVDLSTGTEVTTWTADHDTGGFSLTFTDDGSPPAGTVTAIYAELGELNFNVAATNFHQWRINDVSEMFLTNANLDLQSNNLVNTITTGTVTGVSGITGLGTLAQDIEMGGFDLRNISNLEFQDSTAFPGVGVRYIVASAAALFYNVPTGDFHAFAVQGANEMVINATEINMLNNNLINVIDIVGGADNTFEFDERAGDPAVAANKAILYAKDVGGNTHIFQDNSTEAPIDLTTGTPGEFTAAWTANHNNGGSAFALEDAKFADPTTDTKTLQWNLSGMTAAIELTIATSQSTAQTLTLPNIAAAATVYVTPALQDLEMASFDLRNISNLEFQASTGFPGIGVQYIANNTAGMFLNVPTLDVFRMAVQGVNEFGVSATEVDCFNNKLSRMDPTTITDFTTVTAATGDFVWIIDATDGNSKKVNASDFLSAASQTPWTSDIDAATNSLSNLDLLDFDNNVDVPAAAAAQIYWDIATGMTFNVPTGDVFEWRINNVVETTLSATALDLQNNDLTVGSGTINFLTAGTSISEQTNDLIFDVSVGDSFSWDIAGVPVLTMDANFLDLKGHILQFNTNERINMETNDMKFLVTAGNTFEFDVVGGGSTLILSDTNADFQASTLTDVGGITTTAGATINVIGTGATGFIDIAEITAPAAPAANVVRLHVKDVGGNSHIFQDNSTEAAIDLTTGSETTAWTADHTTNGNSFLLTDDTTPPAGTIMAIYSENADLNFNVTAANLHQWRVNDVLTMTLSDVELDMRGQNITMGVGGILEFSEIAQDMTGNTDGIEYDVPLGDTHEFFISGTTELLINSTATTLGVGSNLIIQASGAAGFVQMGEITDPAAGTASGKFYVKDVAAVSKPFFIGEGQAAIDLSAGGEVFTWTADHSAGGFDLNSLSNLVFQSTASAPLATERSIHYSDVEGMVFNALTGDVFRFEVNGILEYTFNTTDFDFIDSNLLRVRNISTGDVATPLWDFERTTAQANDYIIGELRFRHPDGGAVQENYAKITGVMEFDDAGNEEGSMKFFVTENGVHDDIKMTINDAGSDRLDMFVAEHRQTRLNNVAVHRLYSDRTTPVAATVGRLEFAGDSDAAENLVFAEIAGNTENVVHAARAGQMSLRVREVGILQNYLQMSAGRGDARFFRDVTLNGSTVQLRTDGDDAGDSFFGESATNEISLTAGGQAYVWSTTAFTTNGKDVILGAAGTLDFSAADTAISEQAGSMFFDVPTTESFSFDIAGISELLITAGNVDFSNNTITDVGDITLNDGATLAINSSGSAGFIDIDEITTPLDPAANVGRLYVKDLATVTTLFFRDTAGLETNVLTGTPGEFTAAWTADHNQGGSAFGLQDALFVDPTVTTKKLQIDLAGMTAATTAILDFNFTTAKTITFPDATGNVVIDSIPNTYATGQKQTFHSSQIVIRNPTDTFEHILVIPLSGLNRTITFPDATDTLMGKATADVMTNKSYDLGGAGNVLTGSLAEFNTALQTESFAILGANTFTATQTLGTNILQFANANTTITAVTNDLEYDVATGEVHRWRVNNVPEMILTGGVGGNLDLQGNSLVFNAAAESIGIEANDMIFDVTAGDVFRMDIAGATAFIFTANELQVGFGGGGTNLLMSSLTNNGYVEMGQLTTLIGTPAADFGRYYTKDVATVSTPFFIGDDGVEINLATGSETTNWTADHSTNGNSFLLTDDATPPAATVMFINSQATDMHFNVSDADTFNWTVNGVAEMTLSGSSLSLSNNIITNVGAGATATLGAIRIGNNNGIFWRNAAASNNVGITVNTSDTFLFDINAVNEMSLSAAALDLQNNDIILGLGELQFDLATRNIHQSGVAMRFDEPTGGAFTWAINTTGVMTLNTTSLTFQPAKNVILQGTAGNGYLQMDALTTPATPADGEGRYYLKELATITTPFFIGDDGVEINLATGSETVTWTADHSTGGNSFLLPDDATPPAATLTYITAQAGELNCNIATGNTFQWSINAINEFTVNSAGLNIFGGLINDIGSVTSSSVGGLRIGNNIQIGWRNAADTNDVTFGLNGADDLVANWGTATGDQSFQIEAVDSVRITMRSDNNVALDSVGRFVFQGRDSVPTIQEYCNFAAVIRTATSGSEDGSMQLRVTEGGVNDVLYIDCNGLTTHVDINKILDMNNNQILWSVDGHSITPAATSLTINASVSTDDIIFQTAAATRLTISDTIVNAASGTTFQEVGVDISPIGIHDQYIAAGALDEVTAGAVATRIVDAGVDRKVLRYMPFANGAVQFATVMVQLPRNYNNGTITAIVHWTSQVEGTGTVEWDIAGAALADGNSFATVVFGTAQTATDTQLTIDQEQLSPRTAAITIGNVPADEDMIVLKIQRDGVTDTFTQPAQLLGITLNISTDAATAA